MVTVNDNLITNFIVGTDQLSPQLMKMGELMSVANSRHKRFEQITKKVSALREAGLRTTAKGYVFAGSKRIGQEQAINRLLDMRKKRTQFKQAQIQPAELTSMGKYGAMLGELKSKGINVNSQMRQMEELFGKNSDKMKVFNSGMADSIKKTKMLKTRFDMNTLSYLFAGMAMQRIGLGIMRFMIPSMDKLNKMNNASSKKIMGVAAAFEFLKISIFETLMGVPMVQTFIEEIIKIFITMAEFVQEHPKWTVAIAGIGIAFATLGIMLMDIGIAKQTKHVFNLAWIAITEFIGKDGKGGKIGKSMEGFKEGMGIALMFSAGIRTFNALTNEETSSWGTVLMTAIQAGLGAGFYFDPTTGFITGLVIAAVLSLDKIKDDAILERLNEATIRIQTIFNKLGKQEVSLGLEDFQTLIDNMANYVDSSQLDTVLRRLNRRFEAGLFEGKEDVYRAQLAGLFESSEQMSEDNNPFINIADLTKGELGLGTLELLFFNMWDDTMNKATGNNLLITKSFAQMAILGGQTIKTEIITPLEVWEIPEKTMTIRAKYVGFKDDNGGTPSTTENSNDFFGEGFGSNKRGVSSITGVMVTR